MIKRYVPVVVWFAGLFISCARGGDVRDDIGRATENARITIDNPGPEDLRRLIHPLDARSIVITRGVRVEDQDMKLLARASKLQELRLSDLSISDAGLKLLNLGRMRDLRSLELTPPTRGYFSNEITTEIRHLTNLEALDLTGVMLSNSSLSRLRPLEKLKRLRIQGSDLNSGFNDLRMPSLRYIDVSGVNLPNDKLTFFSKAAPSIVNVQGIEFHPSHFGRFSGPALEELSLVGMTYNPGAIGLLKSSTHLNRLELQASGLDDSDVGALLRLKRVRCLKLGATPITTKASSAISGLVELAELELNCAGLHSSQVASLLTRLKRLRKLTLTRAVVDSEVLRAIAQLHELCELSLEMASIKEDATGFSNLGAEIISFKEAKGTRHLFAMPFTGLLQLRSIDFSRSDFDAESLPRLLNCERLLDVNVSHTAVRREDIILFRKMSENGSLLNIR